jgi:hypothetical protein
MIDFITLFDKNYLARGLTLYNSLIEHCDDFNLFILAIDIEVENYFNAKNYNKIKIINIKQLEASFPELLKIKSERTKGEYCWTLTPYCVKYAILEFDLESCIYIDSDIFFFNNPGLILDELGDNSILITEHNYTPEYDKTDASGKYCVQFTYFRSDTNGIEALEWWRLKCRDWCYSKYEDGKFGDQKYLDDWVTRFNKVFVPNHIGCGTAPWNIQQYEVSFEDGTFFIQDKITKLKQPLVFYHFHQLKKHTEYQDKISWFFGNYPINKSARELLYTKYLNELTKNDIEIKKYVNLSTDNNKYPKKPNFFRISLRIIKNILKSFCFLQQYKYYSARMNKNYVKEKSNILDIVIQKDEK